MALTAEGRGDCWGHLEAANHMGPGFLHLFIENTTVESILSLIVQTATEAMDV